MRQAELYLLSFQRKRRRVLKKIDDFEEYRQSFSYLKPVRYDTTPGQKQGQHNGLDDRIIKIVDKEMKLAKAITDYLTFYDQYLDRLSKVEDGVLYRLLYLYYVKDKSLHETASEIGREYKYTCLMRIKAVEEFARANDMTDPP